MKLAVFQSSFISDSDLLSCKIGPYSKSIQIIYMPITYLPVVTHTQVSLYMNSLSVNQSLLSVFCVSCTQYTSGSSPRWTKKCYTIKFPLRIFLTQANVCKNKNYSEFMGCTPKASSWLLSTHTLQGHIVHSAVRHWNVGIDSSQLLVTAYNL